jgi:hypothetical protein
MKEEMARKVREWMVEEGIYKDKIADENADYHFIAEVPPNSRQFIDIVFPKNRDDMVVIASGIKLSEEHYRSLMTLSFDRRNELLWEMRFTLLFLPTGFQILPNVNDPQLFQFTRELYFDGLNKNLFMDAVKQVHRCKLYVIWMMQKISGGKGEQDFSMYR